MIEMFDEIKFRGGEFKLDELRDRILSKIKPGYTPKPKRDRSLFLTALERYIQLKAGKTQKVYLHTLSRLKKYCPDLDKLRFDDITRSWLIEFDAWLASNGSRPNTRGIHFRNIRTVFNFAIDDGITTNYPFRKFSIPHEATRKRALSVDQLRALFSTDVPPARRQYVDYFMLTFLLIGINPVDLLQLHDKDIIDGRVEYTRQKTKRLYSIKLEPEAEQLIAAYKGDKYLISPLDRYKSYDDYLHRVNLALKAISHNPDITSYWARHTWATIAASLDIPKETIAAALGHGMNTVTDIYIDFDRAKVDRANRAVIDFVFHNTKK
jgi:site-specific recombinase XerD